VEALRDQAIDRRAKPDIGTELREHRRLLADLIESVTSVVGHWSNRQRLLRAARRLLRSMRRARAQPSSLQRVLKLLRTALSAFPDAEGCSVVELL
jgi:hypothetical protein